MTGIESPLRSSLNVREQHSTRALRLAPGMPRTLDMGRSESRGQRSLFRLAPAIFEPEAENARRNWDVLSKPTGVVGKYYRTSIP